jgi:predicted patatin/cPLA2 family phospholipase
MIHDRPRRRGTAARALSIRLAALTQHARASLAAILVLAAAGCASPQRLPPVPVADTARAFPLGLANARFFPLQERAELVEEFTRAVDRQRATQGLAPDGPLPAAELLAISGGADNGAFGSGLLVGWTEAGDRPEFEVVTGVSTGALIAPFAFLGPKYDRQLRDVYTTITPANVFRERSLVSAIFNDAMADTTPLWELISRYLDESMIADLAHEYQKGRLLLIGTTDLDAQRANIWNIGAIAASGHPGAPDLLRKILRASSAVPGVFQPVLIDVDLDGKKYQEMHVDGGAIAQMFLYPPNVDVERIAHEDRTAYLILNAREDPEWAVVEPRTLTIAGRAISTMIHSSGANDLLRIYFVSQLDGIDYNAAFIGSDFSAPHKADFDQDYMNALFDYAYQQARTGYPWQKQPPALAGRDG